MHSIVSFDEKGYSDTNPFQEQSWAEKNINTEGKMVAIPFSFHASPDVGEPSKVRGVHQISSG